MLNKHSNLSVYTALGILGFTILIFQAVYVKNLILIFGLTAPAIATLLASFFLGFAGGNFIFGKLADKASVRVLPKLFYFIFLGIGMYGLISPLAFKFLNIFIKLINSQVNLDFSGFNIVAVLLSLMVLFLPTILMGGGFVIASKLIISEEESLGRKTSILYFIDTLGGVAGAFIAGFVLLPNFGNIFTIIFASILSLITGFVLFIKSKKNIPVSSDKTREINKTQPLIKNKIYLYALFVTGFLAFALEVFYTKTLILFIGSSTYAFSIILVIFLLGIALGSILITFYIDRIRKRSLVFGSVLLFTAVWLIFTAYFFSSLPAFYLEIFKSFESLEFSAIVVTQFIFTIIIVFPVSFALGMLFPLGIKFGDLSFERVGEGIGRFYYLNILGGVLGSLITGFILLTYLGFQKTLIIITIIYLGLGSLFIFRTIKGEFTKAVFIFLVSGMGLLLFFLIKPWSSAYLASGPFPYAVNYLSDQTLSFDKTVKKENLIFYKEGLSQVAVLKREEDLLLRINGKTDASSNELDSETQKLLGLLPVILHKEPEDILVVGLGSGITAGTVSVFDDTRIIDVVEIDPKVVEAAEYFSQFNNNVLKNEKTNIINADGRNYLFLTDKTYDVISSEPSNAWVSGNSYLFTREYYMLAKNHLNKDGIMVQWVQAYRLDPKDLASVIKTFNSVFPKTYIADTVGTGDILLIGTEEDTKFSDIKSISERFNQPKVKNELLSIFIRSPYELLAYLTPLNNQSDFIKYAEIHKDSHPFLEYSAPKSIYLNSILPALNLLGDLRARNKTFPITNEDNKLIDNERDIRLNLISFQKSLNIGSLNSALLNYKELSRLRFDHPIALQQIARLCFFKQQTSEGVMRLEVEAKCKRILDRVELNR